MSNVNIYLNVDISVVDNELQDAVNLVNLAISQGKVSSKITIQNELAPSEPKPKKSDDEIFLQWMVDKGIPEDDEQTLESNETIEYFLSLSDTSAVDIYESLKGALLAGSGTLLFEGDSGTTVSNEPATTNLGALAGIFSIFHQVFQTGNSPMTTWNFNTETLSILTKQDIIDAFQLPSDRESLENIFFGELTDNLKDAGSYNLYFTVCRTFGVSTILPYPTSPWTLDKLGSVVVLSTTQPGIIENMITTILDSLY